MSQDFAPSNPFRRSILLSRGGTENKDTGKTGHVASFLDSTSQLVRKEETLLAEDPKFPGTDSKKNRLSSPPTAPARDSRLSTSPRSYQPFTSDSADASPTDPFDSAPEDDDEDIEKSLEDLEEDQPDTSITPYSPREAIPPNPFRKVLDGADDRGRRQPLDYNKVAPPPSSGEPSKHGPARTSLDVDAFKRLILTGSTAGSTAASSAPGLTSPQVQTLPQASPAADCGNSTDTSSISRQSIFEPTLDAQLDTPRTSHEISASDEERQRLVQDGSLSNPRRKKPPPPRTRHGKLIKDNGYSPSLSSLSQPSLIPADADAATSASLKPSTNLNKPLPPSPQTNTPESEIEGYEDAVDLGPTVESSKVLQAHLRVTQHKTPPDPPVARRRSQRSKLSQEDFTDEAIPQNEVTPRGSSPDGFSTMASSSNRPPPPPPIRRTLSVRSASNVPIVSAIPPTPPATSNPTDPLSALKWQNAAPPPPPIRSPSTSSTKRPPRRSSILSGTVTSPPLLMSAAMPPPPPPPRQRGSSRSSLDNPMSSLPPGRTSGEFWSSSGESASRESGASLGRAPGVTDETNEFKAKDILADLSALQKEVDELRGKYEK
ncbi:hypothetical protein FGG08_002351 [Glutinoglossum americanum]|uniref:Uncharacterized protein n=1 Tax=Glutinoglossum americanum TaxID=1670608 RepID=A0A9P8I9B8_9PEZI|nr:hypothetical protein FGG08_002351 [Glutinoglossum americanum]